MKTLSALLLALLVSLFADFAAASDKHILEPGMIPAAKELWSILGIPKEGGGEGGPPPAEEFAQGALAVLKDQGEFPNEVKAKLEANKPIRDPKEFTNYIDQFPDQHGGKRREALRKWFSDEARTAIEKEAMFFLLQFIRPRE